MNAKIILKLRKMGENIKILYVEDDEVVSGQLEVFLKKVFKNIDLARDGLEGIELYEKEKYDIVITDIEMPRMNGIDMIKEIKEINDEQIIVVTSAYNDAKYLNELINCGIDKFVIKPFDMVNLLKTISRMVIQIYNNKKFLQDEIKLKESQKLNSILLNTIDIPIIVVGNNVVEYANSKFIDYFNSERSCVILKRFELKNLFYEDECSNLNNKKILERLIDNKSIKRIYTSNYEHPQRYKIDINNIEGTNKYLISFYNVEVMSAEADKLKAEINLDHLTSLYSRKTFLTHLEKTLNSKKDYDVICFGIKYIKEFIKLFGISGLQDVYAKLGVTLIKFFTNEIKNNKIKLYYLDANNFVALVSRSEHETMKELLKKFSSRMMYTNKKAEVFEPVYLDVISMQLDNVESVKRNMSRIENKLYMLKK